MDKKFLVSSFSFVTFSNLITKPLWVLLFIYSARRLGVEQFGIYTFLNSIVLTVSVILDCGFDYLLIREITQKNNTGTINTVIFARIMIFLLLCFIIIISYLFHLFDTFELLVLFLLLLFNLCTFFVNSVKSVVSAFHKFREFSVILLIEKLSIILIGFLALIFFPGVFTFVMALTAGIVIAFYFSIKILRKSYILEFKSASWFFIKKLLYESRFLILINILYSIYFRLDVILLNHFFNDNATLGLYGSLHRIIEMYILIPTVIMSAGFPIISKYQNSEETKYLLEKLFSLHLAISFPVAVIFAFNSYDLNYLIYGADYYKGAEGMKYIIWTIIPLGFNYIIGNLLITIRKEYYSIISLFAGSLVSIVINLILIPKYSFIGAAVTILITESVILFINSFFVARHFGRSVLGKIYLKLLAILLVAFIINYFSFYLIQNNIINILFQTLICVLLLFIFKILKPNYILEYFKNLSLG